VSTSAAEAPHERALRHVAAVSSGPPVDPRLRITVNFHPDRPIYGGGSVLASMAAGGRYLSQFATGTSNGGLTAHPGGDRWNWEHRLFGGAYDDQPGELRPVYGTLSFQRRPVGGRTSVRLGPPAAHCGGRSQGELLLPGQRLRAHRVRRGHPDVLDRAGPG
jgi:hypothetical protein